MHPPRVDLTVVYANNHGKSTFTSVSLIHHGNLIAQQSSTFAPVLRTAGATETDRE